MFGACNVCLEFPKRTCWKIYSVLQTVAEHFSVSDFFRHNANPFADEGLFVFRQFPNPFRKFFQRVDGEAQMVLIDKRGYALFLPNNHWHAGGQIEREFV